jgi:hypothetical protein
MSWFIRRATCRNLKPFTSDNSRPFALGGALQTKLREVARFDGCPRLQLEVQAAGLAARAALRLQMCMPVPPPSGATLPPAAAHQAASHHAAAPCSPAAAVFTPPLPQSAQAAPPVSVGSKRRAGSPQDGGSPRGAAQKAKLDPLAWASAEAVPFDPWLVLEAHQVAADRAARDQRQPQPSVQRMDGIGGGVGGGPKAAHFLAGAVRRPRGHLLYATPQQEDR